ncbi:MAG: VanZ family protein, partial [Intestinibacter bartlettii]
SVLYAISDEIHQYFVPGRACQFRDVMIDSCGALFGIAVIVILKKMVNKIKNIYNNKKQGN